MDNDREFCRVCRFCTYEDKLNGRCCHNEDSDHYGELVENTARKLCDKFTGHTYNDMSLKDALGIITNTGLWTDYKLPDKDNKHAYVVLNFKTNNDLEDWRDALVRLFTEYLNLRLKDGDNEDE